MEAGLCHGIQPGSGPDSSAAWGRAGPGNTPAEEPGGRGHLHLITTGFPQIRRIFVDYLKNVDDMAPHDLNLISPLRHRANRKISKIGKNLLSEIFSFCSSDFCLDFLKSGNLRVGRVRSKKHTNNTSV